MEGKKEAISKPKTTRDDIRFPTTKERKNHQRFVCVLQISCSFSFVFCISLSFTGYPSFLSLSSSLLSHNESFYTNLIWGFVVEKVEEKKERKITNERSSCKVERLAMKRFLFHYLARSFPSGTHHQIPQACPFLTDKFQKKEKEIFFWRLLG